MVVFTPEVLLQRSGVLQLDPDLQQLPDSLLIVLVASELEVVHVDAKHRSELGMPVAAGPIYNGKETCFTQLPVTMLSQHVPASG